MKIGTLDMHCGNCRIIDYCSDPFDSLCLCVCEALKYVDESEYLQLAEAVTGDEIEKKNLQYAMAGLSHLPDTNQAICDVILEKLYAASAATQDRKILNSHPVEFYFEKKRQG